MLWVTEAHQDSRKDWMSLFCHFDNSSDHKIYWKSTSSLFWLRKSQSQKLLQGVWKERFFCHSLTSHFCPPSEVESWFRGSSPTWPVCTVKTTWAWQVSQTLQGKEQKHVPGRGRKNRLYLFFQHAFRRAQTRTHNHTSDVSVGRLLALKYFCSYWS